MWVPCCFVEYKTDHTMVPRPGPNHSSPCQRLPNLLWLLRGCQKRVLCFLRTMSPSFCHRRPCHYCVSPILSVPSGSLDLLHWSGSLVGNIIPVPDPQHDITTTVTAHASPVQQKTRLEFSRPQLGEFKFFAKALVHV